VSVQRTAPHRKNLDLESVLGALSAAVAPGGDVLAQAAGEPRWPMVFIAGTARSGSTLLSWWLARSGALAVPSNLVSRFWRAPAVGALVEQLLTDPQLDFRGELHVPPQVSLPSPYAADIGKTRGLSAPHEFWYFWRHTLGFSDPASLGHEGRKNADVRAFLGHLAAYEQVVSRPLATKALIAAWDLDWLGEVVPQALFLDLRRDPLQTMQSLLSVRERHSGSRAHWYSFRLPDMTGIEALSPELQVAVQVRRMRAAIDQGLSTLKSDRVLAIDHAELCRDPAKQWGRLREWYGQHGPLDGFPEHHPDTAPPFRQSVPVTDPVLQHAWDASAELG